MDERCVGARLKAYLEGQFPNDGAELAPDTDLLEDWFMDSLGIVETVLFIEEEFGLALSRADINGTNFRDLRALSAFIAERLNA